MKSRNQLSSSLQRIRDSLLVPLRDAFAESVDISPKVRQALAINREQCLKRLGLVNTHMFLCDLHQVENIFHSTYRRRRGSRSRIPRDLYPGYKLTIAYLLDRLADAGLSRHSITSLVKTSSWRGLDRNYRRVQHELIDPIERDIGIDFGRALLKVRPVSETTRRRLLRCSFALPSPTLTKEEEVRKVLLWYPTRLVGSEGITWPGVIGVITLLEGVMSYQKSETIRVVRFDHPGPNGNDYSFAVLVPSFSNYSEWWVFPNFCNDHSGTGGSGFRELSAHLKSVKSRVGERLSFQRVQVEKEQLVQLIKAEAETENRPTRYSQDLQQLADEARGWVLELVAGNILRGQGYTCFHRVRKSTVPVLGDYELDVLGIKLSGTHSDLLLVECSAGYTQEDVTNLKRKLRLIRENSATLLNQLKLPKVQKAKVEGWLLTAERLPARRKRLRSMRVIDSSELDRLTREKNILWKEMRGLFPQTLPRERVRYLRTFADFQRFSKSLNKQSPF